MIKPFKYIIISILLFIPVQLYAQYLSKEQLNTIEYTKSIFDNFKYRDFLKLDKKQLDTNRKYNQKDNKYYFNDTLISYKIDKKIKVIVSIHYNNKKERVQYVNVQPAHTDDIQKLKTIVYQKYNKYYFNNNKMKEDYYVWYLGVSWVSDNKQFIVLKPTYNKNGNFVFKMIKREFRI